MTGKQHLRGGGYPASPPALPARSHRPSKTPPPPLTPTRSVWPPRAASCPLHSKASDAFIDFKCIEPEGGAAAAVVAAAAAAAVDKARRNYSPVNHIPPGSTGHHSLLVPITLRAAQHLMQAAQQAKRRRNKMPGGSGSNSSSGRKQRSQSQGRAHGNIYQPAGAHRTSPSSPVPIERPPPPPPYLPPPSQSQTGLAASSVPVPQTPSHQTTFAASTIAVVVASTVCVEPAASSNGAAPVAATAASVPAVQSSATSKSGFKHKLCRLFHRGSSLSSMGTAGKPPTGQTTAGTSAAAPASSSATTDSELDSLNNNVAGQANNNDSSNINSSSNPVARMPAVVGTILDLAGSFVTSNASPPATPARRGRDLSLDAGARRLSRQQHHLLHRHAREQSTSATESPVRSTATLATATATPSAFRRGRVSPVHLRTAAVSQGPHSVATSTALATDVPQAGPAQATPPTFPPKLPPRSARRVQSKFAINFLENLNQLKRKPWYFGPLSSGEADEMLKNRPDGTFLVRDSAHDSYIVSLSFRARGQTYHTRIEHNKGKFSFWSQPENHSASTIVKFIESAVEYSKTENFHYFVSSITPGTPPIQVSMLYPLSRFSVMTSLQHMCRFEILVRTRRDHIDCLPLPRSMRQYLQEKQYFIECMDDFLCDEPPAPQLHPNQPQLELSQLLLEDRDREQPENHVEDEPRHQIQAHVQDVPQQQPPVQLEAQPQPEQQPSIQLDVQSQPEQQPSIQLDVQSQPEQQPSTHQEAQPQAEQQQLI